MSELSVDKITGKTGTGGSNSPLQFSGDTVTLGTGVTIGTGATIGSTPFNATLANATFPAGHLIKKTFLINAEAGNVGGNNSTPQSYISGDYTTLLASTASYLQKNRPVSCC